MVYGFSTIYDGVCNVQMNFDSYFKLLTNKAMSIFKFSGLPDTVDEAFLKEQLILGGKVCFTKFDDKLYALNGNVGGEPNCYYEPQNFIIANPILGSKQVKIRHKDGRDSVEGLDGILVALTRLDQMLEVGCHGGLYNLIYKYAGLLSDNDVSLNCAQINGRLNVAFTADDEQEARTAELVLREYYAGKPYKVLTQNILQKISVTQIAQTGTTAQIVGLIEAHRSLLQDFYNEIGIGYQGNSKRERVNTAEIGLMRGCLDISLEGMLESLEQGIEKVNELFGTDIKVEVNENIFYEGSGNATLGVEEEEVEENKTETETVEPQEVDEKNDEEVIDEAEEKAEEMNGGETE